MRGAKSKLLVGLVALTVLAMVLIDLAALFVLNVYATDRVDSALEEIKHSLNNVSGRVVTVDGATVFQQVPEGFLVAFVDENGRIVRQSTPYSLTGEPITAPRFPQPVPGNWARDAITLSSSDTQFRVRTFDIGARAEIQVPDSATPVRFRYAIVAGSLAPGEGAVHQLLLFELIATGAAVIAVSLFGLIVFNRSTREQRESEARLREFIAAASHELRTPLTTIRGWAELHRVSGKPELTGLALTRIEQEADRMSQLVDQMLQLTSLEQGPKFRRDPVDLRAIAAELIADASVVQPDRQITLDAPEEATVPGDANALRQVIGNLITNAVKHTPAGTPVTVSIRGGTIAVTDHGPGMSPEVMARIFDRFYRAEGRTFEGGTGLGLSIVRSIVQAHGGEVTVSSEPDAGSTFTVSLPTVRSSSDY